MFKYIDVCRGVVLESPVSHPVNWVTCALDEETWEFNWLNQQKSGGTDQALVTKSSAWQFQTCHDLDTNDVAHDPEAA